MACLNCVSDGIYPQQPEFHHFITDLKVTFIPDNLTIGGGHHIGLLFEMASKEAGTRPVYCMMGYATNGKRTLLPEFFKGYICFIQLIP